MSVNCENFFLDFNTFVHNYFFQTVHFVDFMCVPHFRKGSENVSVCNLNDLSYLLSLV